MAPEDLEVMERVTEASLRLRRAPSAALLALANVEAASSLGDAQALAKAGRLEARRALLPSEGTKSAF